MAQRKSVVAHDEIDRRTLNTADGASEPIIGRLNDEKGLCILMEWALALELTFWFGS
jgi:hypothetical protein